MNRMGGVLGERKMRSFGRQRNSDYGNIPPYILPGLKKGFRPFALLFLYVWEFQGHMFALLCLVSDTIWAKRKGLKRQSEKEHRRTLAFPTILFAKITRASSIKWMPKKVDGAKAKAGISQEKQTKRTSGFEHLPSR